LKAPKEKLFLRKTALELNPTNQKQTDLYKKVRDHIKRTGYIINPLLVIEDGTETILKAAKNYKEVNLDE
jgi:hypothetical protein